jgi:RIO kinase 1
MDRLQQLLEDGVIDEVYSQLKSGKEADVFLVSHRGEPVAAKLYKAREFRSFKNDAGYKEGRQVRNTRTQRAMEKGSRFGRDAAEEAWKSAEADAMFTLHAAGVRVPKPVLFYEGVLLMEVIGDAEGRVAPRLVDAGLAREQAEGLYKVLRGELIKMLCADLIHGDLSEFNVLLGVNGPVIIDFPQVVAAAKNSRSEHFLKRDVNNMLRFFSSLDPSLSRYAGDADEIWRAYVRRELSPHFEPRQRPPGGHGGDRRDDRRGPTGAGGPGRGGGKGRDERREGRHPREDRGGPARGEQHRQRDERGGHPRDERGGHPRDERGGHPRDERGGQPHHERGGHPREERGGHPRDERGGHPRDERGGQPHHERGGHPRDERGGQPHHERGGQPRDERGGQPRDERGGRPRNDRGGPPRNDRGGPPRNDRGGPPRNDRGASNDERRGGPPQDRGGGQRNDRRDGRDARGPRKGPEVSYAARGGAAAAPAKPPEQRGPAGSAAPAAPPHAHPHRRRG